MRTRLLQDLQKKTIWFKSIVALTCLLLTSHLPLHRQRTVTGTVTDATNEPLLIGASVLVQGTSTGTITDMDGKYSISVTPEDVTGILLCRNERTKRQSRNAECDQRHAERRLSDASRNSSYRIR